MRQNFCPQAYLDDSDGGTGSISVFGERNAIYNLGAGGGLGLNYFLGKQLRLSAGYLADGLTLSDPRDGRGLFNGGYSAIGQLTWTPAQEFSIAATYINAYFPGGRYGFNYNSFAVTGTAVANTLAGQTRLSTQRLFDVEPVITNSYGLQATFQPSPRFAISGWFGATYARLIERDGQILNYALTFAFPDLGQEGNLLGMLAARSILGFLKPVTLQVLGFALAVMQLALGIEFILSGIELQALVIQRMMAL